MLGKNVLGSRKRAKPLVACSCMAQYASTQSVAAAVDGMQLAAIINTRTPEK